MTNQTGNAKPTPTPNLPSKNPGQKSGPGRGNNTPTKPVSPPQAPKKK